MPSELLFRRHRRHLIRREKVLLVRRRRGCSLSISLKRSQRETNHTGQTLNNTVSGLKTFCGLCAFSLPGYVYDSSLDSCILATQGTFAPGGYRNQPIPCPPNTTTSPDKTTPLTSLQDCLCDKGYEPADSSKLHVSTTSEFRFKLWLKSISEYEEIKDSQICVPCGMQRFKGSVSAEACEDCPAASSANTHTPKSRQECKVCGPGFYETSSVDMACGQCPERTFCVGSEPLNPSYQSFAGLSWSCPDNSSTVEGSGLKDHPFKCV